MNKSIFLLISTSIFTCEKPAPQKPKVIATSSYHDSIQHSVSHLDTTSTHVLDSLPTATDEQSKPIAFNDNFVTYTNAANRILHISYENKNDKKEIKVIFPEKNINTTLPQLDSQPNTYAKDNIKWETDNNHHLGKLTVFGTWFEFVLKD